MDYPCLVHLERKFVVRGHNAGSKQDGLLFVGFVQSAENDVFALRGNMA